MLGFTYIPEGVQVQYNCSQREHNLSFDPGSEYLWNKQLSYEIKYLTFMSKTITCTLYKQNYKNPNGVWNICARFCITILYYTLSKQQYYGLISSNCYKCLVRPLRTLGHHNGNIAISSNCPFLIVENTSYVLYTWYIQGCITPQ